MNSQEIRDKPIGGGKQGYFGDIAFFLRELTAQVAEMNERSAKQESSKHRKAAGHQEQRTSARKSSTKKYFRPSSWNVEVEMDGIVHQFKPYNGQPLLDELNIGEVSIGDLGTKSDVEVKRIR